MSETEVVQRTVRPHNRDSLAADLRRLGLAAGDVAVLLALQDVPHR